MIKVTKWWATGHCQITRHSVISIINVNAGRLFSFTFTFVTSLPIGWNCSHVTWDVRKMSETQAWHYSLLQKQWCISDAKVSRFLLIMMTSWHRTIPTLPWLSAVVQWIPLTKDNLIIRLIFFFMRKHEKILKLSSYQWFETPWRSLDVTVLLPNVPHLAFRGSFGAPWLTPSGFQWPPIEVQPSGVVCPNSCTCRPWSMMSSSVGNPVTSTLISISLEPTWNWGEKSRVSIVCRCTVSNMSTDGPSPDGARPSVGIMLTNVTWQKEPSWPQSIC